MGFEKDAPKSGFFQIFDWTAKSRKKLFSNKSDLPESSKQGKRSGANLPTTRLSLIDDDDNETGIGATFRGGSDFSCASSVTDEEGYGSRAPSVVARLMGLDSLPNSTSQDPYSTPYFDTRSLQEAQQHHYSERNLGQNSSSSTRSFADPKPKRPAMMMIEKFRTEVLPPRSARSIPVTHHRLMSPIKSPGFVPSGDVARVMEAATKIIEPGRECKTPLSGSSSVPMKVQALREKAQATQRATTRAEDYPRGKPVESNAAKCLKGQSMTKSWNGSGSKNEGKSISLAIQAKVNVQKREGLSSASERQQNDDAKSTPATLRSQQNTQKCSSKNPSGVLRQNNQKQNNSSASKPLVSNAQSRKLLSSSSSSGRQKVPKTGPRKSGPTEKSEKEKKEAPYSVTNSFPRRKRSMDGGDPRFNKNLSNGKTSGARNQKAVRASENWAEESRRKGLDVVSFTFTAPLTRSSPSQSLPGSDSHNNEQCNKRVLVDSDGLKFPSSMGYNVLGGDALSLLLEEKLRELTFGLESSSSASAAYSEKPARDKRFDFEFSSTSGLSSSSASNEISQGLSDIGQFEAGKLRSPRHLSPVSILEPSFSVESCESTTFTADSISTEGNAISGSKLCWTGLPQAQETNAGSNFPKKFCPVDADSELSDSASSLNNHHLPKASIAARFDWELEYVKEILFDVDTMFNDFASGCSLDILNPDFFDTLESRKRPNMESSRRRRRKELFDSVSECLDLRFNRCVNGGFEMWAKGSSMVTKIERLAEEIYREISGRERGSGDSMVDELVENDMTGRFGKWLDFEAEVAELGVGLDDLIFDSLINELVADVFAF